MKKKTTSTLPAHHAVVPKAALYINYKLTPEINKLADPFNETRNSHIFP